MSDMNEIQNRLPIEAMLRDANAAMKLAIEGGNDEIQSDLACHVMALAAEVVKLSRAATLAYNHLDTYGVVNVDSDDPEIISQDRVFAALRDYTKVVGHSCVSIYGEPES